MVVRAKYVHFSLHYVRSLLSIHYSHYGNNRMFLHVVHISVKQWANNFRSSGYYFMLFLSVSSCCCRPTPGWLDSNDVCMSGGSWACGRGTTKERSHCGHTNKGNTSHQLTVGPPPHTYIHVMSEISNCLVPSTNCRISQRHYRNYLNTTYDQSNLT